MHRTFILLFSFVVGGCSSQKISNDYLRQFYGGLDPVEQADIAFSKGKYQIYSAMGYALYFPGLDQNLGYSLDRQFSSIPIPGTSDLIGSESDQFFQKAKVSFASKYNIEMLTLLRKHHKIAEQDAAANP